MPNQNVEAVETNASYPFEHPHLNEGERMIAKAVAEINATGDAYYILQDFTLDDVLEAGKLLTDICEEPLEFFHRLSDCLDYSYSGDTTKQIMPAINLLLRLGILSMKVVGYEDDDAIVFIVVTPKYNPWYSFIR